MPQTTPPNDTFHLERLVESLPAAEYRLDALFLYDDRLTHKWASAVHQQVQAVAGRRALRSTWWKLDDLHYPGVLAGAVSKALRADVIVIATRSSESMPLPFYVWVNSWLPHHPHGRSLLVGLLGRPQSKNRHAGRLRKYLKNVARVGRMDTVVSERAVGNMPELQNGWLVPTGFAGA